MKFRKYSKNDYRKAFEQINGMESVFTDYAKNYKVSIEKAIKDRDFPLTRLEVVCLLKNITGNWPKNSSVELCYPENDSYVMNYRRELIAEYRSVYG